MAERAQTEPLGALVAAVAVCLAVSLYAAVLVGVLPGATDRTVAESTLERVSRVLSVEEGYQAGTLTPDRVPQPAGRSVRVSITVADEVIDRVTLDRTGAPLVGHEPPRGADRESRVLPTVVTPGNARPGRLLVEVWP